MNVPVCCDLCGETRARLYTRHDFRLVDGHFIEPLVCDRHLSQRPVFPHAQLFFRRYARVAKNANSTLPDSYYVPIMAHWVPDGDQMSLNLSLPVGCWASAPTEAAMEWLALPEATTLDHQSGGS